MRKFQMAKVFIKHGWISSQRNVYKTMLDKEHFYFKCNNRITLSFAQLCPKNKLQKAAKM